MKKNITFCFLMMILTLSLSAQDYSKMRGSQIDALSKQNGRIPAIKSPNSPRHQFDVLNYNLDLDIYHCYASPYLKTFSGTNTITFKVDSTLSSITLNAENTSISIVSITGNAISFSHQLNHVNINLDRTYQPGETAEIVIKYNHLGVSDNAFYASNGFVFTDAEPQGARKWFPCYDEPSDKATLQLRAKVPLNVKLGSNGSLTDSVRVADSLWYTWTSRDPISTYLMVISSKVNYKLAIVNRVNPNNPNDILPFRFYYNQGENPTDMINMIVPLTDFYVSKFGEHPFEKNGFAAVGPQFTWGGMENQSLTSICGGCWYSSLIAHEYAHQWFGDMITCATWADIFLNEGFATYVEALWTGEVYGYGEYVNEIESNASNYMSSNPGWPISDPEWATNPPSTNVLFNYAITYAKGSCVLYMFRNIVGDSLFFHALYEYATDTVNFRYNNATIPDFVDKMNEETGMDLDYFFDEWLYTPNHPSYFSTYEIMPPVDNKWEVKLNIKQTQTNTGFFTMPVEIRVSYPGLQGDSVITVLNYANDQNFSFTFNKQPVSLQFDPQNKIVLKNSILVVANENIALAEKSQLKISPNPSNGNFNILFTSNAKTKGDISLVSQQGTVVYSTSGVNIENGDNAIPLKVANLAQGTYYLALNTGNNQFTQKVVIVK